MNEQCLVDLAPLVHWVYGAIACLAALVLGFIAGRLFEAVETSNIREEEAQRWKRTLRAREVPPPQWPERDGPPASFILGEAFRVVAVEVALAEVYGDAAALRLRLAEAEGSFVEIVSPVLTKGDTFTVTPQEPRPEIPPVKNGDPL